MSDILRDVVIAIRRLRAAPTVTLFAIVTLAIGIGLTTPIDALASATILRPPNIRDTESVVNIYHHGHRGMAATISLPELILVPWLCIGAGLLASVVPARRATRVDPSVVLRDL